MRFRRTGIITMVAFGCWMLGGWDTPQGCNDPQPSVKGPIIGAAVGLGAIIIGTVILVHVHNKHHRVEGCVYDGPEGLEVREPGSSVVSFRITGDIDSLKAGEIVKLKGDRVKKAKNSTDDQQFVVNKVSKIDKKITNCQVPDLAATKAAPATSPL